MYSWISVYIYIYSICHFGSSSTSVGLGGVVAYRLKLRD
jgi:hypothetical protein